MDRRDLRSAFCLVVVSMAGCSAAPREGSPPVETTPSMIAPDDADTIPCAPRLALQTVCQQCHTDPPLNGAPFPLIRRSDIVRQTDDGEVRLLMIDQLEVGRMPLWPTTIEYNAREALLDWLHAGAPAEAPHACAARVADGGAEVTEP